MDFTRILRHLLTPAWRLTAAFSASAMKAIEAAIQHSEKSHNGQIRFAVEAALHLSPLLHNVGARERARAAFSGLRVWDTEHNNGVLIYLLLADRNVEIIADRGIDARIGTAEWERICRLMEAHFSAGRFEQGVTEGVRVIGEHLQRHFPGAGNNNELPDAPVIL